MKRALLLLAICGGILVAPGTAAAVTKILKQGVDEYAGCSDTYIDVDNPTYNYGALWYMHLYMSGNDPERSLLVRFNLDGVLPPGSVVANATLSLWLYQKVDWTQSDWVRVGPYRIRNNRDWIETQATWNVFRGSTYWSTAGCENTSWDRYGTPDSNITFTASSPINAYYHWDVTASVQAWLAGAQNHGWLVRAVDHDGGNDGLSFNAKESGSAGYRPYLTIVYEEPVSVESSTWGTIKALFR